jgi:DNA-binding beta-propeller fold protein YncE
MGVALGRGMGESKPLLDVRAVCRVGGIPGEILPSSDGTLLFVQDRFRRQVSLIATGRMNVFQTIDLGSDPLTERACTLLGAFGDDIFAALQGGKIAVLSAAARQARGVVDVRGEPVDFKVLPDAGQAVAAVAAPEGGFLVHLDLAPCRVVFRRPLPGAPVPGTLSVELSRNRVSVAVHSGPGASSVLTFPLCAPGPETRCSLEGTVGDLVAEAGGEYLYAAIPAESEVAVLDLSGARVIERLRMAGRPFQLLAEPDSRRVWATCEGLGHAALIDVRAHRVVRRIFAPGTREESNRIAISPDGRLLVVPEFARQSVSLAVTGIPEGDPEPDRLEVGRSIGAVAWSPLGDELYVSDPEQGDVLALRVDRGALPMKDTDHCLAETVRARLRAMGVRNPLFPP